MQTVVSAGNVRNCRIGRVRSGAIQSVSATS